jgi:hypothetical protein
MKNEDRPPSFSELLASEILRSTKNRGWRAYFPFLLIVCLFAPGVLLYIYGERMNSKLSISDAVTILSSISVIGSFLGAASVALTAHLQKIVSEYPFSNYLKSESMFDSFLFWPQFVLLIQIICTSLCIIFNVIIGVIGMPDISHYFIVYALFIMLYAFSKTWKLIDIIRIVTWHYEDYISKYNQS